MISFEFTERDRELLSEARRQANLAAKYARDLRVTKIVCCHMNIPKQPDAPMFGPCLMPLSRKPVVTRSSMPCSIWKIGTAAFRFASIDIRSAIPY